MFVCMCGRSPAPFTVESPEGKNTHMIAVVIVLSANDSAKNKSYDIVSLLGLGAVW